jgi:tetratricopeptide (TPR) repeat protein
MSSWQLTVLTALLLAVQTVPQLDGQWTSVRTSAFEAVGDVEQSRIIAASVFFEHVLDAIRLVIPSVKGPAASPITVIVTEDSRLISERFVEGRYRSYAMVDARQSKVDASTVSGVVRQLIRTSAESPPLWVEVGLGEFLSTANIDSDGSGFTFGNPVAPHLVTLRERMLPIAVLLSTTLESPEYLDPMKRRLFVAQSWLLVHYLCAGDIARRTQLGSYVKELAAGTLPELALKLAFGVDHETLGHKLSDYAVRSVYRVRADRSTDTEPGSTLPHKRLTAGEAAAIVGDVLMQAGKVTDALERLRRLRPEEAQRSNALGALGRVRAVQGNRGEALRIFSESVRDPGVDDGWRYHYASTLLRATSLLESNQIATDDARVAQKLLAEVHQRNPEHADVLALLGLAQLALHNPGGAIQQLTDAFRSCPRHEYALLRARAHIAAGDAGGAQRLLVPLVDRGQSQAIRQAAEKLLEGVPGTFKPPIEAIHVFREPKNDELKASGYLAEITCSRSWTVLHVRLDDRVLRLATTSLKWVDFISYRRDRPPAVACGTRHSPERVWVIYRPDKSAPEGTEGFVKSVEFAPGNLARQW